MFLYVAPVSLNLSVPWWMNRTKFNFVTGLNCGWNERNTYRRHWYPVHWRGGWRNRSIDAETRCDIEPHTLGCVVTRQTKTSWGLPANWSAHLGFKPRTMYNLLDQLKRVNKANDQTEWIIQFLKTDVHFNLHIFRSSEKFCLYCSTTWLCWIWMSSGIRGYESLNQ